jgi:hypothetical protein
LGLYRQKSEVKISKYTKYYPRQLLGILFFIWTYIGYVSDLPEKHFFLINLIVLGIYLFILIFSSFSIIINFIISKSPRTIVHNKEYRKQKKIPLAKIVYFFEIILSQAIITNHFILPNL